MNSYLTKLDEFVPGLSIQYTYSCVEPGTIGEETNSPLEPDSIAVQYYDKTWYVDNDCINEVTDNYINNPIQIMTFDEVIEKIKPYDCISRQLIEPLKQYPNIFIQNSWDYIETDYDNNTVQEKETSYMITVFFKIDNYLLCFDVYTDPQHISMLNLKTFAVIYIYYDDFSQLDKIQDIDISDFIEIFKNKCCIDGVA